MSDPMSVSRRLVAVFAADVEGYSRLMGSDEVGTLKGLTERRDPRQAHRGSIANTAGDSVLAAKRVARMSPVSSLVPCGEHAAL
jgi:adenylate cyclase